MLPCRCFQKEVEEVVTETPVRPPTPAGRETSTSSTSASSSGKRSSTANDGPESKKKKTEREAPAVPERSACGNCGGEGHKAAFCVKIGRSGWMEACPKCDSTEHLYEACPYRVKGPEDFRYLIFNRQRKPPVKSRMVLGKIIKAEVERAGSALSAKDEIELPYSSKYARQADRLNPQGGVRLPAHGQPREGDPMTQQPSRRDVPPPIPTDLQHVPQRPVQGDSTRAIVTAQACLVLRYSRGLRRASDCRATLASGPSSKTQCSLSRQFQQKPLGRGSEMLQH
ncbi:hypothetical protein ANO14919_092140 [Xylariales sp. No.14919]|nr:hypothetical protein ANO14919_092140 [Xylariales sp. No.14919]